MTARRRSGCAASAVVRDGTRHPRRRSTGRSSRASAGSCSGPNGSGKTTLAADRLALPAPARGDGRGARRAARPRRRPRAAHPHRAGQPAVRPTCCGPSSTAVEVVMTATLRRPRAVVAHLRRRRPRRGPGRCSTASASATCADRAVRHAVVGRAPAGAARPRLLRRPGPRAARRADRRPRPRRPRGARRPALAALAGDPTAPPIVLVTHHVEEIPPGLHPRAAPARRAGSRRRAARRGAHRRRACRPRFGLPARASSAATAAGGQRVRPAAESRRASRRGAAALDLVGEQPVEHGIQRRPP